MACVDVCVPCYNYGRYLAACVRSALDQDGVSVRVLIIDDASSDSTEAVGRELAAADSRVEFRRHASNRGHITTFNEGIDWAAAEYLLLLSADDVLVPGALRRAATLMDGTPSMAMTCGRVILIDEAGTRGRERPVDGARALMSGLEFWQLSCALAANVVWTPAAIVRTAVQQKIGGYRHDLPHTGDMEMWFRLAAHGSVGYVDDVQALYRVHGRNMSVLNFTGADDLKQRLAAFDMLFGDYGRNMPDRERLETQVRREIAWKAFWLASSAFDRGDSGACAEAYKLAMSLSPRIRCSGAWCRYQFKRAMGAKAWAALRPLLSKLNGHHGRASAALAAATAQV